MEEHSEERATKRRWTIAALLALGAVVLLTVASPAVALRPRTTPRHAEALAARAASGRTRGSSPSGRPGMTRPPSRNRRAVLSAEPPRARGTGVIRQC